MGRIIILVVLEIAVLLIPVAGRAQGQPKPSGQNAKSRESVARECRAMYGRTGKGATDNTSVIVEQCIKERLGKK